MATARRRSAGRLTQGYHWTDAQRAHLSVGAHLQYNDGKRRHACITLARPWLNPRGVYVVRVRCGDYDPMVVALDNCDPAATAQRNPARSKPLVGRSGAVTKEGATRMLASALVANFTLHSVRWQGQPGVLSVGPIHEAVGGKKYAAIYYHRGQRDEFISASPFTVAEYVVERAGRGEVARKVRLVRDPSGLFYDDMGKPRSNPARRRAAPKRSRRR